MTGGVGTSGPLRRAMALVFAFTVLPASVAAAVTAHTPRVATSEPLVVTVTTIATSAIPVYSTTNQTDGMPASAINLSAISLGTKKASTTPKVGYLDRCGGAPSSSQRVTIPPWVNTSAGTWNATTKIAVAGHITYAAAFSAKHVGSHELLIGNGLPQVSGVFPVASSDPADAPEYNPDPTAVTAHNISLTLPYNPTLNAAATCENGAVGITTTGIPLLDGFDALGNDAAAVETQDACHGHPNPNAGYHYHSLSPCLLSAYARTHTTQVGWALDGFGIYVEYNAEGQLLTDASLDACHGRTSVVPWHGKMTRIYHYDMTFEFPYTVGCFRGTPQSERGMMVSSAQGGGSGGGGSGGSAPGSGSGPPAGGSGPPPGGGGSPPPGGGGGPPPGGGGPPPGGGGGPSSSQLKHLAIKLQDCG